MFINISNLLIAVLGGIWKLSNSYFQALKSGVRFIQMKGAEIVSGNLTFVSPLNYF